MVASTTQGGHLAGAGTRSHPQFEITCDGEGIVGHAGTALLVELADRLALTRFMARTSAPWALLPVGEFGCGSATTSWRRFAEWAHARVFERLQELLLDALGEAGGLDWSWVSVELD